MEHIGRFYGPSETYEGDFLRFYGPQTVFFFCDLRSINLRKIQNFKITLIGLWRTIKPTYVPKIIEFG